eukprot:1369634-Amorphochlora_amoeboformis.AAC.1
MTRRGICIIAAPVLVCILNSEEKAILAEASQLDAQLTRARQEHVSHTRPRTRTEPLYIDISSGDMTIIG